MSELRWSKEAIGARVDQLARDHQGDAFVVAVQAFCDELLDEGERTMLQDVLMERANLRSRIVEAARERRRTSWSRRMMEGRFGRRPPASR
jgi:hypothetical protein